MPYGYLFILNCPLHSIMLLKQFMTWFYFYLLSMLREHFGIYSSIDILLKFLLSLWLQENSIAKSHTVTWTLLVTNDATIALPVSVSQLDKAAQTRVYKRVLTSGAIPISRDTPSYVAVMSVLHGEEIGKTNEIGMNSMYPVSYTHLTLPTIYSV